MEGVQLVIDVLGQGQASGPRLQLILQAEQSDRVQPVPRRGRAVLSVSARPPFAIVLPIHRTAALSHLVLLALRALLPRCIGAQLGGETGSGSLFCRCDPMPIGFLQRLLRSTTRSSWPQGLSSSLQHLLHGQVGQRLCRIRCVPSSGCGGSANGQARVTCHCSARDLGDSGWHPGWALNRSLRKPPHPGWAPHLLLPR
jgi:hypothetical protein